MVRSKRSVEKTKAKAAAPAKGAAPLRVQPPREVKTKEYQEAHRVHWSVRHSKKKDPNSYYLLVLRALSQLHDEDVNATKLRVFDTVKSLAAPGAFNIRGKVEAVLERLVERGRARISSTNIVTLKSWTKGKRASPKRVAKKKTAKRVAASKKKTSSKAKVQEKPAPKKRSRAAASDEVEEAPVKKRSKAAKGAAKDDEYIWEYKERDMWFPYAQEASDIVEAAYQDYLNDPNQVDVRSVKSGMWCYQVDFTNMTQTNIQHENHTVRDIRRSLVQRE